MKHYWFTKAQQRQLGHVCGVGCREMSKEDIIEQQKIDADCNDCKHFKRGQFHKSPGLDWFDGHCLKFDKPTKAYPMQFTGHFCFEHRKE